MHKDIQKAIDKFKEIQDNNLRLSDTEQGIVFDCLTEKEAAELECFTLSPLLKRQAI